MVQNPESRGLSGRVDSPGWWSYYIDNDDDGDVCDGDDNDNDGRIVTNNAECVDDDIDIGIDKDDKKKRFLYLDKAS